MDPAGSGSWRECQAVLILYLGILLTGVNVGFSAVAIPDILAEASAATDENITSVIPPINATREELSWFASSVDLGLITGSFFGGWLGSRFGPKRTISASSIPGILSWIIISTSSHLATLIVGRVLAGVSYSISVVNISLLVSQYSCKERRGAYLSLFTLAYSSGILLVYVLGSLLYWRIVAACPVVLYVLLALGLSLLPESPLWLLSNGARNDACRALQWLRGEDGDIERELEDLVRTQENQENKLGLKQALKNLQYPDIYRPFLLISVNFLLVTLTGAPAITYYAIQVFQDVGVAGGEYFSAIILGIVRVLGGIVAIFVIHKFPRTILANITVFVMAVCMIALGTILYIHPHMEDNVMPGVFSVVCIIIYMFFDNVAAAPLLFVWLGELLPPEYTVLSGVIGVYSGLVLFLLISVFPVMLVHLAPYGTFWLFASICLACNVFYVRFMPETKGMTILEIKTMFQRVSVRPTI